MNSLAPQGPPQDATIFRRTSDTAIASDPPSAAHRLFLLFADRLPQRFPIGAAGLAIGRTAENDIVLDSPGVSRRHCQLELVDDAVRLTDLGSTNGTFLDGEPVVGPIELTDGARLQIGPHSLRYERLHAAAHEAALSNVTILARTREEHYAKKARRQTALARFGELALKSDDLDEILTKACELVGEALGIDLAMVLELQQDGETLLACAGVGWRPGVVGLVTMKATDSTPEGQALRAAEPMIFPDIATDTRFTNSQILVEHGVKAAVNVAIIGGQGRRPFGILQIDSREPRQFTTEDTIFLRGYANLLAAAVDRLRVIGEVREAEERLRVALEAGALGSWDLDPVSGVITVTPRYRRIFGHTEAPAEWTYDLFLRQVLPEYRGLVAGAFRRALDSGDELQLECRIHRASDAEVRWIEARGRRVSGPGKTPTIHLLGVASDITERKQADESLHRSNEELVAKIEAQNARQETEARFLFATQAGRLGVWELDLPTEKLTASAVCKANFGHERDSPFTYAELCAALHPADLGRVTAAISDSVASGADCDIECRVVRRDGVTGWVQMYAQVVRAADGAAARLAGISLDITDRVLTEERVRQSQRIEAVGRLTAGVAHDFNNVLQSLLGGLELVIMDVEDRPQIRADLERALRAGQRGARLTSHLLSFARQQALQPTALELPSLIAELSRTLERVLGGNIAVVTSVPAELPHVLADEAHLESALLNLALNARDAMPSGGVLSIEARALSERIVIVVADTGEGMAPDVLARACEPFFSTKGEKGSGLGLSSVHGFVQQSDGEFRIESVLGRGTRIELSLPVAPSPVTVPLPIVPVVAPARNTGRILVVDDDPDVSYVTVAFLRKTGFEVVAVAGAAKALEEIRSGSQFDAVVTDYSMNGMSGAELVLQIRALQGHLRALIATGYIPADKKANLPPDVTVLHKPFKGAELVRQINSLLGNPLAG
jgi:PAS domain S-box-containing protein